MKISLIFLFLILSSSVMAEELPFSEEELLENDSQAYSLPTEGEDQIQRQEDFSEETPANEWSFNSEENPNPEEQEF